MSFEEDLKRAEELGTEVEKANFENRLDDRKLLRDEWREIRQRYDIGTAQRKSILDAHWDAADAYFDKMCDEAGK